MAKTVYLDHAAATPMDKEVLALMQPYFAEDFFNPSADYAAARRVRQVLDAARSKIAYWLGAQANEIIFTAGGTEANNLAIHGVMAGYPKAKLLLSAVEHESVRQPAEQYAHQEIPVDKTGRIDLAAAEKLIDDQTVLVSVMYANNEIGSVQPIRQLSGLMDKVRAFRRSRNQSLPLLLHVDACQAVNYLDLHVKRLGVDLMTINGGKIYGPKQSGALYVARNVGLKPIISGGGQERNLRSGTENVAADIGLAAALDIAQSKRAEETLKTEALREYFITELENNFKDVVINGSRRFRLANNVHATFPGQDNESLLIGLDQKGVMAAAGSACNASKEESSHVLLAMGLSDALARASLRFSLGRTTTKADIDHTIAALSGLIS